MVTTSEVRPREAKVTKAFRLPEELLVRLGHVAVDRRTRDSEIVREALEAYLPGERDAR